MREGVEHRHFFGAGRAQVFDEQRFLVLGQGGRAGGHNLVHVFLRFGLRVDAAYAKPWHLSVQCDGQVRSRVGRRQVHGLSLVNQPQCNGGGNGGFAHPAFAHDHDQAPLTLRQLGHQLGQLVVVHGGRCGGGCARCRCGF